MTRRGLFVPVLLALLGLAQCAPVPMGYYGVPPRAFQVYFAFGGVGLSEQSQAVLRDAAAYAAARPGTVIRVMGHADAPGAPEGNAAISRRRSEMVVAELNRLGVARERMSLEAFADTRPAVIMAQGAMGQGAMQPENRRVEILIH